MDVRNCNSCGRLYNYYGGQPYCPSCMSALDEKFKDVKEYIYNHPNVGVKEVADEFEISTQIIYRWVREERLSFTEGSAIGVPCQGCGVTIQSGRFCNKCKQNLLNGFSNTAQRDGSSLNQKNNAKSDIRMRFLNE